MSDTGLNPTEEAAYRAGASILTHTDSQEEMERAKAGLPGAAEYAAGYVDPMGSVDDLYEGGRRYDDVDALLRVAVRYWISGSDETGRWLPDEMQKPSALVGLTIEHQAALFVESTDLFESAKLFIWIAFRRQRDLEVTPLPLRRYLAALDARLPHTFYPPRPEMCRKELDRIEAAAEAARQAEIDAKHIRRAPGMAKIFQGFNADWNEF